MHYRVSELKINGRKFMMRQHQVADSKANATQGRQGSSSVERPLLFLQRVSKEDWDHCSYI